MLKRTTISFVIHWNWFYIKWLYSENSGIKTREIYKNCKVSFVCACKYLQIIFYFYHTKQLYSEEKNDLQLECMLCSSKLLHEEDLYTHKVSFSLYSLSRGEGPSLHGVPSCFCQVAHHRLGGQKDDLFLQAARAPLPIYCVGKPGPLSVSTLCLQKGAEQQLLKHFASPVHWHLHNMCNLDLQWQVS